MGWDRVGWWWVIVLEVATKKKKKKPAKVRRGERVYLDMIIGRKKEGRVLHVHM